MNKPIREGFVSGDDDGDEDRVMEIAPPPTKPHLKGLEPPPKPVPAKAAPKSDAGAPEPLDLDAPPPEVQWPVVLKLLHKPTRNTKNEVIHELQLRAPTARDILQCGMPARLSTNGDVISDPAAMVQMLAALADVFPPMIEKLDARDFASCAFFLQRFFLPNAATWMPTSTTS